MPARCLTTVTHFLHFPCQKNVLEKCARSTFDDCYTLLAVFELQKCARTVCLLDFYDSYTRLAIFELQKRARKVCPHGFWRRLYTFCNYSNCKNVPASIFDDSYTLWPEARYRSPARQLENWTGTRSQVPVTGQATGKPDLDLKLGTGLRPGNRKTGLGTDARYRSPARQRER